MNFLINQVELFFNVIEHTWQKFWSKKGAFLIGLSILCLASLKLYFMFVGSIKFVEPAIQIALFAMGVTGIFVICCYSLMIKYAFNSIPQIPANLFHGFSKVLWFVVVAIALFLGCVLLSFNIFSRNLPFLIIWCTIFQFIPIVTLKLEKFDFVSSIYQSLQLVFYKPIAIFCLSASLYLLAWAVLQLQFIWFVSIPAALSWMVLSQVTMFEKYQTSE